MRSVVEQSLYDADRDRWIACLFAPEQVRSALHGIFAFSAELSRIRDTISQPLAGEIRLQWWRDVLEKRNAQEVPTAVALLEIVERFNLSHSLLMKMIEGHVHDVYNDPFDTLESLEKYLYETCAVPLQLGCSIVSGRPAEQFKEICRDAGLADGYLKLLWVTTLDEKSQNLYFPQDHLLRLKAAVEPHDAVIQIQSLFGARARFHVRECLRVLKDQPRTFTPVFLPLALTEKTLQRLETSPYRAISQWRRQWLMWRATRTMCGR